MGFILPVLQKLIDDKEGIFNLSKIFPICTEIVQLSTLQGDNHMNSEDLKKSMAGLYIYEFETKADATFLKPLGVNPNNPLSEQTKWVYLCELYNFLQKNKIFFIKRLNEADFGTFMQKVKQLRDKIFIDRLYVVVEQLKKLTPVENAIHKNMVTLQQDYLAKTTKDNLVHKVCAAFGTAVSHITPVDLVVVVVGNDIKNCLSYEQQTAMGAVMLIVQTLYDEYQLLSPLGSLISNGSELYKLCCKILNISGEIGLEEIDPYTRRGCLSAAKAMLADPKTRKALELEIIKLMPNLSAELKKLGIDTDIGSYLTAQIETLHQKIAVIIPNTSTSTSILSKIAKVCGILGGALAAVFGGSIGSTGAQLLNTINPFEPTKYVIGKGLGEWLTVMINPLAGLSGYYLGNVVVDKALELSLASACAAFLGLMGAGTSYGVVLTIPVVTKELVNKLWELNAQMAEQLGVTLAKDVDPDFIKCLLAQSEAKLPAADRKKIKEITLAETNADFLGSYLPAGPAKTNLSIFASHSPASTPPTSPREIDSANASDEYLPLIKRLSMSSSDTG